MKTRNKLLILIIFIFFSNNLFAKLNIVMFGERGCHVCESVAKELVPEKTKKAGVNYSFKEYLVDKNLDLFHAIASKYGFHPKTIPVLFVGEKVLAGRIDIYSQFEQTLIDYKAGKLNNADVVAQIKATHKKMAKEKIVNKFKSWDLGTVIGAGLIDGINPCAFATIIFLISYLAFAGKKKREVVIIGTIYTLAVFITYMSVGLIFFEIIDRLRVTYGIISSIIFYFTLLLCVVFAVFTFFDYLKALSKKTSDMKLTLPSKFKQKIHKVIRENVKMRGLILSSVIIGFLVSVFELACTGQVYLPTIMFILHNSSIKAQGFIYLLIYNVAFILPLVIIFCLNLAGISSKKLGDFLHKHVALTKLLLFLLFIGIAVYLVLQRFAL